MELKFVVAIFGLVLLSWQSVDGANRHRLVAYWGQNAVYNLKKETQYWEKDLSHFCQNSKYDVIVLAFMHVFFDRRQKDALPALNFAFHCETSMSADYPFLLRCPKIEAGIKKCQKNGKQVILSLGGATGGYGFSSDAEAKQFANTVWHLVLGGGKMKNIRPFGSAVLDGVDLDIEGGTKVGYSAFVRELRALEKEAGNGKYLIAAAPQCPYPDHFLGPSPGAAFGDVPELFDEIYIQFYNNYCHTGDAKQFYPNFKQWINFSKNSNGPKIFIGMPSHERAAYGQGYWRTPSEVATIYQKVKNEPRFGGFMLWDASFDDVNRVYGKPYSESIAALFGNGGGPRTTNKPHTLKPGSTTKPPKPNTTKQVTQGPTSPTGPVNCKTASDGTYPDPKDCSKFIECSHGKTFRKTCPPGLKFNPTKKYCDWAANVNC